MKDILPFDIAIEKFSWQTKRKVLTAFASDLPKVWLKQIWGDSCDEGFKVRGRRETKLFALEREEKREGEVVAWHLREQVRGTKKTPWVAIVYND